MILGGGGIRAPELIPVGAREWKTQEATSREDKGSRAALSFWVARNGREVWQPQRPVGDGARRERRFGAERIFRGMRAQIVFLTGPQHPSPATPAPSAHLKPALGHSVHVPPHGAGGCGRGRALRRARLGAPGRPRSSGTETRQRTSGMGPSAGRRDLSTPAGPPPPPAAIVATTARRQLFSLLSLNFNPKQKHSPPASNAAPHWAEPPGPRNSVGRGRRRSAPRRRTTPPPSPGRARGRQPKSYGSAAAVAAARARSRLQGRQAHREKERQGSAYVSVCICLWEGLWGGCECARARRPVREKKAGQLHTAPEPPPLPSATDSTHQPTKHLSCLSCPPSPLSLVASQQPVLVHMSFPATQLPSPITHCRLEPKVQQAVPARSHFPPFWQFLDWGSAAAAFAAAAVAAAAAASPASVDCITGCCSEAWGAAVGRGSPCAWIRGHSCVAVCSGDEQRGRTSCLVVRGCSAEAGRPFLQLGEGRALVEVGAGETERPWLPPPLSRPTAAGTQWALALTRPPMSALVGESLILTPLWREKQACLNEQAVRCGAVRGGAGGAWDGQLAQWLTFSLFPQKLGCVMVCHSILQQFQVSKLMI